MASIQQTPQEKHAEGMQLGHNRKHAYNKAFAERMRRDKRFSQNVEFVGTSETLKMTFFLQALQECDGDLEKVRDKLRISLKTAYNWLKELGWRAYCKDSIGDDQGLVQGGSEAINKDGIVVMY